MFAHECERAFVVIVHEHAMHTRDRYSGCVIGLAASAAPGAGLVFRLPGIFTPSLHAIKRYRRDEVFRLKVDDTSMALDLVESPIGGRHRFLLRPLPPSQLDEREGAVDSRGNARRPTQLRSAPDARYRSSGRSPVRLAIRASMRGPISSESWNAKTKSSWPGRARTRCDPVVRFNVQPIR
jgi:hypothetical protein